MNIVFLQQQLVFIVGFIIGFIIAFLSQYSGYLYNSTVFHKDSRKLWNLFENWPNNAENYDSWRQNQNVQIQKMDSDIVTYREIMDGKFNKVILESEWLKNKVPVTCVVFSEKLKLATVIKDTWGQHCNQLLFFSRHFVDINLPVIDLGIKYISSWQLLCEAMNYVWKNSNEEYLSWIIFVKDDTIVITENLRYMLASLDFRKPYYLGHAIALWGIPYNVAEAGYVLSFEVLRKLMAMFNTPEKCVAGGKYWKKEDYYLGKHLVSLGIYPSDTRDSEKRGIFHGFSLNILLWGVAKPGNYYTRALYPVGPECCSNKTITFSIGDPNKMRTISYILYQLQIFNGGIYGNRPAPTQIPENEVWKTALRDEFNLTDIIEISREKYFQIWRSKYSEPEQFIVRNFKTMPKVEQLIVETYNSPTEIPKIP